MASYLQIENISKSYGPKVLFENIGFNINEGDKIALIAPNGTGKTSLMRILAGKDKSDSGGKIMFLKDIRIAFLEQEYPFDPEKSIFDQIMTSSEEFTKGLDQEHPWEYERRVVKFLTSFNLPNPEQKMKELSGGEVKRVALSQMLATDAEFFIMDEPTNHLDIDAIEFLEGYLSRSRCTLLMVTHDRYFLDRVCNTIIEMERGAIYTYKGDYQNYLEKRDERIANYNAETDKVRNILRRELEWIRSTPCARTGKARYRINAFYDLKDIMESFENRISRKPVQEVTKKVAQEDSLSFQVIKCPDGKKIFVADPHRKDLIEALEARFGEGITIIRPRMLAETYRNLSAQGKDGTYLERPRPDVRTLYFQNGEFRTSVTLEGETLPDRQARMSSRQQFCEISEFARSVKAELQEQVGYVGEGSIHFQNAYYPVIHHDKVEIFKGDIFAGSVGIDPRNGLLRIDKGPMEWFGDRTESVFNSVSIDSIKDAIGRFCLDEGIGIHDKDRKLNLEVANNDVANSKDKTLIDSLVMNTEDITPRMRMSL